MPICLIKYKATCLGTSDQGAVQVPVADTVGCGDSFAAACMLGYLRDAAPQPLLLLANAVGAATATGVGAGRNVATADAVLHLLATANPRGIDDGVHVGLPRGAAEAVRQPINMGVQEGLHHPGMDSAANGPVIDDGPCFGEDVSEPFSDLLAGSNRGECQGSPQAGAEPLDDSDSDTGLRDRAEPSRSSRGGGLDRATDNGEVGSSHDGRIGPESHAAAASQHRTGASLQLAEVLSEPAEELRKQASQLLLTNLQRQGTSM